MSDRAEFWIFVAAFFVAAVLVFSLAVAFGIDSIWPSDARVIKVDGCEYVVVNGNAVVHKANCRNHPMGEGEMQ